MALTSSEFISSITKFIIFMLMLISFILLFTTGGLVSSYSIGLFLLLSILTICSLKNIGKKKALVFVWSNEVFDIKKPDTIFKKIKS